MGQSQHPKNRGENPKNTRNEYKIDTYTCGIGFICIINKHELSHVKGVPKRGRHQGLDTKPHQKLHTLNSVHSRRHTPHLAPKYYTWGISHASLNHISNTNKAVILITATDRNGPQRTPQRTATDRNGPSIPDYFQYFIIFFLFPNSSYYFFFFFLFTIISYYFLSSHSFILIFKLFFSIQKIFF